MEMGKNNPRNPGSPGIRIAAVSAAAICFFGCANFPKGGLFTGEKSAAVDSETSAAPALEISRRGFGPDTELDRLLDARAHSLPAVKPAVPAIAPMPKPGKESAPDAGDGATYRIQVDALSNVDAAQARKAALERMLGTRIDMVFDAPYYKLRFGKFSSKREAEDKLVDLAGKNLQGFIVRQ
jgi:hypothetical protein